MLDQTDVEILRHLEKNARLQWKEVGEKVHLTGPAVAARIRKLEDMGIIEGFTVKLNRQKMGNPMECYISVFMKSNDHAGFQRFLHAREEITEAHRTSGGACYTLKACVADQAKLNLLLDDILPYGNYGCSLSIGKIK